MYKTLLLAIPAPFEAYQSQGIVLCSYIEISAKLPQIEVILVGIM